MWDGIHFASVLNAALHALHAACRLLTANYSSRPMLNHKHYDEARMPQLLAQSQQSVQELEQAEVRDLQAPTAPTARLGNAWGTAGRAPTSLLLGPCQSTSPHRQLA